MLETILVVAGVAIPAIVFHEVAHGWAAFRLGDTTARDMGRLSLNPLRHIDPFGTVVLPLLLMTPYLLGWSHSAFLFGYARPVPFDPRRLRDPRRGIMLVRLAGPAVNLLMALVCVRVAGSGWAGPLEGVLKTAALFNVGLAVFNLIPIPPLDGSGVWYAVLPGRALYWLSRIDGMAGIVVVMVLLQLGWLDFIHVFIAAILRLMAI